jgi:hypothetical protein
MSAYNSISRAIYMSMHTIENIKYHVKIYKKGIKRMITA